MILNLKEIILFSRRPDELALFLSSILDYEDFSMSKSDKGILISNPSWTFLIKKAGAEHLISLNEVRDIVISFSLESRELIEGLIHKVQFYYYRQGTVISEAIPKLQKESDEIYFIVKDIDGRKWKFSYSD